MTAFPTQQRAALTRLRENHPKARLHIARRQQPQALRVKLRWPPLPGVKKGRSRTAYVFPDGYVMLRPRSTEHDRQAVTA